MEGAIIIPYDDNLSHLDDIVVYYRLEPVDGTCKPLSPSNYYIIYPVIVIIGRSSYCKPCIGWLLRCRLWVLYKVSYIHFLYFSEYYVHDLCGRGILKSLQKSSNLWCSQPYCGLIELWPWDFSAHRLSQKHHGYLCWLDIFTCSHHRILSSLKKFDPMVLRTVVIILLIGIYF